MTREEHLLAIGAEECAEIAQRFTKAARFGQKERQAGQDLDNRMRILLEYADLVAVMEMLGFAIGPGPLDALRPLVDAKKEKVERHLQY